MVFFKRSILKLNQSISAMVWPVAIFAIMSGSLQAETTDALLQLSLRQAKALAVQEQVQLKGAQEQTIEMRAHSDETVAGYRPSLEFKASQVRQTENLKAMGFDFVGFPTMVGPFNTFDARVRLTQRVFDLSLLRNIDAAGHAVNAAQLHTQAIAQQVAGAAAFAYVEAQRSAQAVLAANANLELSASLLRLAQDQHKAGLGTGVDVVRAENVHSRNTLAQRQAISAAREADTRLRRALGIAMGTPLALTDPLQAKEAPMPHLPLALEAALQHRPELEALQQVVAQRSSERGAAAVANLPTVSLAGDVGPSGVTPAHNDYRTYSFGMQLSIPLLEGGAINARQDVAASRLRQAELELQDTNQQVEEDVRLALISLETSVDQVKTAATSLTLAERLVDQARDRFKTGVGDNLEVVDAQAMLAMARSTRIDALASYQMALINYQLSIGEMDYAAP